VRPTGTSCGASGEPPDDYRRWPTSCRCSRTSFRRSAFGGLRLRSFQPELLDAGKLGFANVRPLPSTSTCTRCRRPRVANLAYHFAFDYLRVQRVDDYIGPLLKELRAVESLGGESLAVSRGDGRHLVICDSAPGTPGRLSRFWSDLDRLLYLQCDGVADVRGWPRSRGAKGYEATEDSIAERLAPICASGLMLRDGRPVPRPRRQAWRVQPTRHARRRAAEDDAREQVTRRPCRSCCFGARRSVRTPRGGCDGQEERWGEEESDQEEGR